MKAQEKALFQVFNEIGIIHQLSSAVFQSRLPDGLHISHFSALNHLVRLGDGKTPLAIANAFQVPKTTMTHTLSVLHKRGLISMAPHASDKRSKLVYLTDAGRQTQQKAIAAMLGPLTQLADNVGGDTLTTILPELERIRKYLDENRGI